MMSAVNIVKLRVMADLSAIMIQHSLELLKERASFSEEEQKKVVELANLISKMGYGITDFLKLIRTNLEAEKDEIEQLRAARESAGEDYP
jgi:hypothetical protein